MTPPSTGQPKIVVEPPRGFPWPRLGDVWRYRDTLYFMARRDVAVRYKQTAIGVLWVVLQPVAFALVYSGFLSLLGAIPSQGVPYPIFALTSMTVWLYWVNAMARISDSTVQSSNLISKIYFPRIVIPVAAGLPPIVDLCVSFSVLMVAMALFGVGIELKLALVPLAVLLAMATAFGVGLWFSALAVRYRDIQQLVPFLIQVLLFVTPILYPFEVVPESIQTIYSFNPLVGMVELFRWAVIPSAPLAVEHLLITLVSTTVLVVTGLLYYERAQREFADVI